VGKVLLVLGILVVALAWWTLARRRQSGDRGNRAAGDRATRRPGADRRGAPATMLACAHCGVHLPQSDALFDAGGRPYCGEAHRLAGPR
jgi:uncharacterized protein